MIDTLFYFLLFAMLFSLPVMLGVGARQLLRSKGDTSDRKVYKALLLRACFGLVLVLTLIFGVVSGKITNQAPWDAALERKSLTQ